MGGVEAVSVIFGALGHVFRCAAILAMFAGFLLVSVLALMPPYDWWTLMELIGLACLGHLVKEAVDELYGR
jgi:hypothetical protein